jgi:hypothetical protein
VTLCQFWGLSERQTRQTWAALSRARWTVAASWRLALCHFEGQAPALRSPERVLHFLAVNVRPQTVLGVLEALIQERLLSRAEGSAIEECLLTRVGATGDWTFPQAKEESVCP